MGKAIILDDPQNHLSPVTREQFFQWLKDTLPKRVLGTEMTDKPRTFIKLEAEDGTTPEDAARELCHVSRTNYVRTKLMIDGVIMCADSHETIEKVLKRWQLDMEKRRGE